MSYSVQSWSDEPTLEVRAAALEGKFMVAVLTWLAHPVECLTLDRRILEEYSEVSIWRDPMVIVLLRLPLRIQVSENEK